YRQADGVTISTDVESCSVEARRPCGSSDAGCFRGAPVPFGVPGLGDAHVIRGRDSARVALSPVGGFHRSRAVLSQSERRLSFVGGNLTRAAATEGRQVYVHPGEWDGLRRISVSGSFVAACFRALASLRADLDRRERRTTERGCFPCDLSAVPARPRRDSERRGSVIRTGLPAYGAAGGGDILRLHGAEHLDPVRSRPG